jgi:hypothetical protein
VIRSGAKSNLVSAAGASGCGAMRPVRGVEHGNLRVALGELQDLWIPSPEAAAILFTLVGICTM